MVWYACGALVLPDRGSTVCHTHCGDPLYIGVGVYRDIGIGSTGSRPTCMPCSVGNSTTSKVNGQGACVTFQCCRYRLDDGLSIQSKPQFSLSSSDNIKGYLERGYLNITYSS